MGQNRHFYRASWKKDGMCPIRPISPPLFGFVDVGGLVCWDGANGFHGVVEWVWSSARSVHVSNVVFRLRTPGYL